jgi:hypothetical protein
MRHLKHLPLILLCLCVLAPLAPAQTRQQLKKQLRAMIAQAKNDTTLLFEAANFAKDHNFTADYKKLIKKILRIDKDHAGANTAEGRIKFEGKWISQADYKKKLIQKLEAEFKAAGKIKVSGVWVDKEKVADAKKGVFHHDNQLVNKWEMRQFQAGKVRHPRTGRFIEAIDLKKAKDEDLIRLPDGRWVPVKTADRYHSDKARPWMIRSKYCFLVGIVPLAELETLASGVDVSAKTVLKIFGGGDPAPDRIATIVVAKTTDDYKNIGTRIGHGRGVWGVYIGDPGSPESGKELDGSKSRLVVMNYGPTGSRKYFSHHAAGLAMCCSFMGDTVDDVPAWFVRGVAAYASQHLKPSDARWYAKEYLKKGVADLRDWFDDFKISIDISAEAVDANICQAGVLIAFCLKGGDKQATDALVTVTEACKRGGKAVPAAVEKLQKVLIRRQKQLKAYYDTLVK